MKKYLRFEEQDNNKKKTKVLYVYALLGDYHLGKIEWKNTWRQYVFTPYEALFNNKCLDEISSKLTELNKEIYSKGK